MNEKTSKNKVNKQQQLNVTIQLKNNENAKITETNHPQECSLSTTSKRPCHLLLRLSYFVFAVALHGATVLSAGAY